MFMFATPINNFAFFYGRNGQTIIICKMGNLIGNSLWDSRSLERVVVDRVRLVI